MSVPTSTGRLTLGGKRRHGKGSKTKRAGLVFPVPRITKQLKRLHKGRTGVSSGIYLAAIMEYLTAEIAELASNEAKKEKRVRIIPKHIRQAIRNDEELRNFAGDAIVPQGGAQSFIHPALIPAKLVKTVKSTKPKPLPPLPTSSASSSVKATKTKTPKKSAMSAKTSVAVEKSDTAFSAKRTVQE